VKPSDEHSAELAIKNPMGFHVRPVQRFAELARLFQSDVEVKLRGRNVSGKSIMSLMTLGARRGDTLLVTARGVDARQCIGVLTFLAGNRFFVEDSLDGGGEPGRHMERLAHMASCFNSKITVSLDERQADAKQPDALRALGLEPTSVPELRIEGDDAEQARAVLGQLCQHCYFVEDAMGKRKDRAS